MKKKENERQRERDRGRGKKCRWQEWEKSVKHNIHWSFHMYASCSSTKQKREGWEHLKRTCMIDTLLLISKQEGKDRLGFSDQNHDHAPSTSLLRHRLIRIGMELYDIPSLSFIVDLFHSINEQSMWNYPWISINTPWWTCHLYQSIEEERHWLRFNIPLIHYPSHSSNDFLLIGLVQSRLLFWIPRSDQQFVIDLLFASLAFEIPSSRSQSSSEGNLLP